MAEPKYSAGLRFIVSTPGSDRRQDGRAVRSHAAKVRPKRQSEMPSRSWISPDREIVLARGGVVQLAKVPAPVRAGSDFSALQLPPGVEPRMVQDLVKLIDLNKHGVYPFEICLDVHPTERGWFPYMISDLCCLHSMMFSVRAFVARDSVVSKNGRLAAFHYAQTLQLLQARLNAFEKSSVVSDATIMVVITLALVAELTDDVSAAANHIDGLIKIVTLRGGLRSLQTHNNMQVKVCRADLGFALRFGYRPRLFRDDISWDCFIADRGMIHCSHEPHGPEIHAFVKRLDTRLRNAWLDLHAFSCVSNLAYQTTRKLSPETYNEMMVSILYRLAHLSYDDPLQEATRAGLLAFSATLFMERHFMYKPYLKLLDVYHAALGKLRRCPDTAVPAPVSLWFTVLFHVLARREPSGADWPSVWLDEAITQVRVHEWDQAHDVLRAIMWVDFVHAQPGKRVFDVGQKAAEGSICPALLRGGGSPLNA